MRSPATLAASVASASTEQHIQDSQQREQEQRSQARRGVCLRAGRAVAGGLSFTGAPAAGSAGAAGNVFEGVAKRSW